MLRIKARAVSQLTPEEVWQLPEGVFELEFDDGVIQTDNRRTIYSYYYWLIHRNYPGAPLLKSHHIGDRKISPGLHLDMCGSVSWDTYFALNEEPDIMELSKLVYDITRDVYNDCSYKLESYVTTVNILDYIDIIEHPEIKKANEEAQPNEVSIGETYAKISEALAKPDLEGNNVKRFVDCRLASGDQVMQSIGPRGHVTDIDSSIFEEPIMTNYTEGFKNLYDSLIESRSGAKALMFTKDPLGKTQYFNRRMQLGCSIIRNLHHGDCGSDQYVPFTVGKKDLRALNGKWYMSDAGDLKIIGEASKDLIGTTVKLRSSLTCQHPDPYGVCTTCMGMLALSIPPETNLGHVAATELCAPVSQAVLSTKHLDKTSVMETLHLQDYHRQFLRVSESSGDVFINRKLRLKGLRLNISKNATEHIGDIFAVKHVSQLAVTRMSTLSGITLEIPTKDGIQEEAIPTILGTSPASLSTAALEYMQEHKWSYDENGDYVIDLSEWDASKPLLVFPRKHMSMLDFMKRISSIIESGESQEEGRGGDSSRRKDSNMGFKVLSDFDSASAALTYLHEEVASKVFVNIAHLEIIIKSTMVRNSATGDYRLPLPHHNFDFGKYRNNMQNRSLSAQMAYQHHYATFMSPTSYTSTNRPDHPMDYIVRG